jgi:hypothetical protein
MMSQGRVAFQQAVVTQSDMAKTSAGQLRLSCELSRYYTRREIASNLDFLGLVSQYLGITAEGIEGADTYFMMPRPLLPIPQFQP